ncbi:uncharacterized protein [Chironomus tepperi]|uniref:uncharacterized protein n=1 Tax=Chironomus tepperi TaxID=113505 RepID=UPI00391F3C81
MSACSQFVTSCHEFVYKYSIPFKIIPLPRENSQHQHSIMKLWILMVFTIAIVAVVSQSTDSTTKKSRTSKSSNKATTASSTKKTKTDKPKGKAGAAAPPPSGKKDNNSPQSTQTTKSSKKITKPPAKASNNVYSKCMCEDDIGMDQFQLSKYLGTWYMVNMQPLMPMNPYTGNCMNVSYKSTSKKNDILAATSSKFSISTIQSNDVMTYLGQGVFTWKLTNLIFNTMNLYPNGTIINDVVTAPMNSTLKYVVIDTDYSNYTVAYICGNYSLGTSLKIKSDPNEFGSMNFTIPPNLFILMSREKVNTTSFDMTAIKNTIRQKYACYYDMNHESAQDSGTCKA